MTQFWWIRHAPVIGNNNCCYGNNEVDCDTSDINSFKKLEEKLPMDFIVFSSPLSRAVKTYFKFSNLRNLPESHYTLDNRLTEQDLGTWVGMKYDELEKKTKQLGVYDNNWLMDAKFKPPGGESFLNLKKRVRGFLNDMLLKYKNSNVVIFSHGGPIRAAISLALNIEDEKVLPMTIDNTKLTRIDYDNQNKSIIKFINT